MKEAKELNLCEILKDCPKGTKLYTPLYGVCSLYSVDDKFITIDYVGEVNIICNETFFANGTISTLGDECLLFPSKDNRDWSTWKNPKPKVERFNPKTFEPFDKVLVREDDEDCWIPTFISYFDRWLKKIITVSDQAYSRVIPYNDDTKHLIGTCDEAPEYYRYWEN